MLFSATSRFVPHGIGRIIYTSIHGTFLLDGYFKEGFQSGFARWIWNDGTYYQGELENF